MSENQPVQQTKTPKPQKTPEEKQAAVRRLLEQLLVILVIVAIAGVACHVVNGVVGLITLVLGFGASRMGVG